MALTAAMPDGTGLTKFAKEFPKRFFDVGIAEAHEVTSAAGMAAAGLKPVVAVYSSFLQRGYDQVLHDVCIQDLPVLFAIDRAGLVGSDGETHQGIFDISFLSLVPGMNIMAPKNCWELQDMLEFGVNFDAPLAIRYPRGQAYRGLEEFRAPVEYGKANALRGVRDRAFCPRQHGEHRRTCPGKIKGKRTALYLSEREICKAARYGYDRSSLQDA